MVSDKTFLSYSRSDSDFAMKLTQDLKNNGTEIWFDQFDIKGGDRWDASIEKALSSSSIIIVVLTPLSVDSENVMDEVSYAIENGKSIIPILLAPCVIPFRLGRFQRVDFTKDYLKGLEELLEVLVLKKARNKSLEKSQQEKDLNKLNQIYFEKSKKFQEERKAAEERRIAEEEKIRQAEIERNIKAAEERRIAEEEKIRQIETERNKKAAEKRRRYAEKQKNEDFIFGWVYKYIFMPILSLAVSWLSTHLISLFVKDLWNPSFSFKWSYFMWQWAIAQWIIFLLIVLLLIYRRIKNDWR